MAYLFSSLFFAPLGWPGGDSNFTRPPFVTVIFFKFVILSLPSSSSPKHRLIAYTITFRDGIALTATDNRQLSDGDHFVLLSGVGTMRTLYTQK